MVFFEDLATFDLYGEGLVAVGWLEPDHPVPSGHVEFADFDRLVQLLEHNYVPKGVPLNVGLHRCGLCRFRGIEGSGEILVPDGDRIFVAPELITHYMDAHAYCPPEAFLAAVRNCPPPNSSDYKKLLLASGGRSLLFG